MVKGKRIKVLVVMVLIIALAFTLTACVSKLSGTYSTTDGLFKQSLTFMEDNKVKVSAFGIDVEASYTIEKDMIIFTYSLMNLHYDMEMSFEKDGDVIFIDGTRFVKE